MNALVCLAVLMLLAGSPHMRVLLAYRSEIHGRF